MCAPVTLLAKQNSTGRSSYCINFTILIKRQGWFDILDNSMWREMNSILKMFLRNMKGITNQEITFTFFLLTIPRVVLRYIELCYTISKTQSIILESKNLSVKCRILFISQSYNIIVAILLLHRQVNNLI